MTQHVADALAKTGKKSKTQPKAKGPTPTKDRTPKRQTSKPQRRTVKDLDHALDELAQSVNAQLQGLSAEIEVLKKNHLSDREVVALRDKVTRLGRAVGGVKTSTQQSRDDMQAKIDALNAGMEDLRSQFDQAHLRSQRQAFNGELVGDWKVGHIVFGTVAALAYMGASSGLSKLLSSAIEVKATGLATAFAAGAMGFEASQEAA